MKIIRKERVNEVCVLHYEDDIQLFIYPDSTRGIKLPGSHVSTYQVARDVRSGVAGVGGARSGSTQTNRYTRLAASRLPSID